MIMSILEENLKEGEKVTDPTEAKVKCQEIAQTGDTTGDTAGDTRIKYNIKPCMYCTVENSTSGSNAFQVGVATEALVAFLLNRSMSGESHLGPVL